MPFDKTCKQCGGTFVAKWSGAKFCSRPCHSDYQRIGVSESRVCPGCGETFTAMSNAKNTYCSAACYRGNHAKPENERVRYNSVCLECGKAVSRVYKGAKYCSKACAFRGRSVGMPTNSCLACGKAFRSECGRTRTARRKYCSVACSTVGRSKPERDAIVTRTCKGCGRKFSGPLWSMRFRSFCSAACSQPTKGRWSKDPRKVTTSCVGCGKLIQDTKSHKRTYCSRECKAEGRRKPPVEIVCKQCGKTFAVDHFKAPRRQYCSIPCANTGTLGTKVPCDNCGKSFKVFPSTLAGNRRFCCLRCFKTYQGETSIEIKVRQALESAGVEFIQEHGVGHYSIDFYLPDHKVAIEADGDYWHSLPRNIASNVRRDAVLLRKGIRTVRLWESEINDTDDLAGLINARIEAVVHVRKVRHGCNAMPLFG